MKKNLLVIMLYVLFSLTILAQKDSIGTPSASQRSISRETLPRKVTIYPVPVRENNFTIKSDRNISFIKITNIIGQDIFRDQFSDPQQLTRIFLNNPKRGMYLVTIIFTDGSKVVKKIMVEESN